MIRINRRQLVETIKKIAGPTMTKSTFPIFSHILMEFFPSKATFSATDLEMSIVTEVDGEFLKDSSFCVQYKKIISILNELSDEEICLDVKNNVLWITCENCEFKLNIVAKDEFPHLPVFDDKNMIRLSTQAVQELIDLTAFCVFTGEGSYVLSGVLCEIEGTTVRMVGTDGKRLAMAERSLPEGQPAVNGIKKFIIPSKTITELSKVIRSEEEDVLFLVCGKNQIAFEFGRTKFISQLIEGEFPDYKKFLMKDAEDKCTVQTKPFTSALKKAQLLASQDFKSVRLDMTKDLLTISKITPQLGEYKETIPMLYKGKDVTIGFNPDYLLDLMRATGEDALTFDIYGAEKPMVYRKEGYLYLALPMRLN
jgi:DNA polymerase-3 subunit beta